MLGHSWGVDCGRLLGWGSTAVDHPGTCRVPRSCPWAERCRGRLLFPLPPNVPACADVWDSRVPVIIDRFAEHYCRAHVWASIIVSYDHVII